MQSKKQDLDQDQDHQHEEIDQDRFLLLDSRD